MSTNEVENSCGFMKCVGAGIATAFFASLERCSCVNLTTADLDDPDDEEAKDRPLMFTKYPSFASDVSTSSRHRPTTLADKLPAPISAPTPLPI